MTIVGKPTLFNPTSHAEFFITAENSYEFSALLCKLMDTLLISVSNIYSELLFLTQGNRVI